MHLWMLWKFTLSAFLVCNQKPWSSRNRAHCCSLGNGHSTIDDHKETHNEARWQIIFTQHRLGQASWPVLSDLPPHGNNYSTSTWNANFARSMALATSPKTLFSLGLRFEARRQSQCFDFKREPDLKFWASNFEVWERTNCAAQCFDEFDSKF